MIAPVSPGALPLITLCFPAFHMTFASEPLSRRRVAVCDTVLISYDAASARPPLFSNYARVLEATNAIRPLVQSLIRSERTPLSSYFDTHKAKKVLRPQEAIVPNNADHRHSVQPKSTVTQSNAEPSL